MPPVNWYPLKLKEIVKETSTTWRFLFDLQTEESFPYSAGQFITCDLPTGSKRAQRWRSYSIANADEQTKEIELCISYEKDGLASEYFFKQIKPGDSFPCKGPEGNFILPEKQDKHLLMICTGTGLAPFRPMLQEMMRNGHDYKSIYLIFGTRKNEDLIYRKEFENWNRNIKNFHSHICLSRDEKPDDQFPIASRFHHGYVHKAYKEIIHKNNFPKDSYLFMICGWSEMIDQAVLTLFSELGFSRNQIRYELYG